MWSEARTESSNRAGRKVAFSKQSSSSTFEVDGGFSLINIMLKSLKGGKYLKQQTKTEKQRVQH